MILKTTLKYVISFLGVVLAASICIGLSGTIAKAGNPPGFPGLPDLCGDNEDFTTEFRFRDCGGFKTEGVNPFFILKPGYQLVLEGEEEDGTQVREETTVLFDTKWINLNGRRIETRVVQERAFEWDDDEEEWVTIEISINWFAICNRTNDVVYFGEFSQECEDGFDEDDECEDGAVTAGSWEAGVDGALPGVIMPGTFLMGSKYFQEIAPPDAVDRSEHVAMGLEVNVPAGNWEECVEAIDTNPALGECNDEDSKTYCPGVGKVKDSVLELVEYGFVTFSDRDDDDHNDRYDGRRWKRRSHPSRH